jgi:hypothetical protein
MAKLHGLFVLHFFEATARPSRSHRPPMAKLQGFVVLVAVLASAPVLAQCTKDTDCKGNRVCVRGECVEDTAQDAPPPYSPPDNRYSPPPPAPAPGGGQQGGADMSQYATIDEVPAEERDAWQQHARRSLIATDPLPILGGLLLGASLGGTILPLSVQYWYALNRSLVLGGSAALVFVSGPGVSTVGFGVTAGARYHFFGTAHDGAWVGGTVGFGSGGLSLLALVGWNWVFDGGFYVGVGAGLAFTPGAPSELSPFSPALSVPVGFAF